MVSVNGLRILAFILIAILVLIVVYVSRLFIGTLVLSILFAYMVHPFYEIAHVKTGSNKIASLLAISTIFVAAILAILVFYRSIAMGSSGISVSVFHAFDQANGTLGADVLQNLQYAPGQFEFSGNEEFKNIIRGGILSFAASFVVPALARNAVDAWIFPALQPWLLNFALVLPIVIAQIIIAAFFAYYLLISGKRASEGFIDLFSGPQRNIVHYFLQELNRILKTLFKINFDVAAFNALVGMIIFSLIGMPFAIVWALLAASLSLIRFLGPWLVFVPLSAYFFLMGDFSRGFLVLLFGSILLEYVPEYLLRPYLSKGSAQVNIMI